MMEQGPQPGGRKLLYAFGITGAVIVILIVVAMAKALVGPGAKALLARFGGASPPPRFAQTDWARRTIQELTLDAPFDFGRGPDVTARIPPQVRQAIDYLETYQSRGPSNNFVVMISRLAYQPEIETDLDGAVHGAMTQAAAAMGDPSPRYSSTTNSISGLPARTASYQRKGPGRTMHIEAAFAARGPKCWQIQILFVHDASTADALRILRSVAINP